MGRWIDSVFLLYTNKPISVLHGERGLRARSKCVPPRPPRFVSLSWHTVSTPNAFVARLGYHHLGAPIAMGSMVAARAEFVWIFVMWNSFVHTIM